MKFLISILLLISFNCLGQVVNISINPVGTILPFLGSATALPHGYLLGDGSCVSKTTYSKLFAILSTTYGTCSVGLFKLPDLRELVLVGAGTNATNTIAAHDVYSVGQFKDDQMQGHVHQQITTTAVGGSKNYGSLIMNATNNFNDGIFTASPSSDGTNGAPRAGLVTRTKQIGVNYIIKY